MSVSSLLKKIRRDLDVSINEAQSILDSSANWRRVVGGEYKPILKCHTHDLAALSFFKSHLAWEEFLEEAFISLLVGARKGTRGARSLLDVRTRKEAYEILKGERAPFVEWSVADTIKTRANRFFRDGRPFQSPLAAGAVYLEQMRKIRNRIAHRSMHAEDQFRKLIREILGSYRPESPGSFLLLPAPSNFTVVSNSNTIIGAYTGILRTMADNIAR